MHPKICDTPLNQTWGGCITDNKRGEFLVLVGWIHPPRCSFTHSLSSQDSVPELVNLLRGLWLFYLDTPLGCIKGFIRGVWIHIKGGCREVDIHPPNFARGLNAHFFCTCILFKLLYIASQHWLFLKISEYIFLNVCIVKLLFYESSIPCF